MLKRRLDKLELTIKGVLDMPRVYLADEDNGRIDIPDLNFSGSSSEGHKLMKEYPNCTFIVDDIPESKEGAC